MDEVVALIAKEFLPVPEDGIDLAIIAFGLAAISKLIEFRHSK